MILSSETLRDTADEEESGLATLESREECKGVARVAMYSVSVRGW